jgi:UTP--glucose-1-phosphate uridylyltransferase
MAEYGRRRSPAKRVSRETGIEGSNPSLSAIIFCFTKNMARSPQKVFGKSAKTHFFPLKVKRQLKKAIIPAAGLGTRMQPLTRGLPKEMLPIGGRPMISYVIHEAALSGLEELYIVINRRKDALRRLLESGQVLKDVQAEEEGGGMKVTLVDQPTLAGSGEAIYQTRELIGEEPFALMMPDFIFFGNTPALGQMIPLYERCACDMVGLMHLRGKEAEGFGNVGIVQGEEGEPGIVAVRSLSSKVSGPLMLKEDEQILKAAPRWILGPHFFSYLERTKGEGEWDDAPALEILCAGQEVVGKVLQGRGFDVGNPVGYEAAEAFAVQLDAGIERC